MVEVNVEFEGMVREELADHIRKFTVTEDNVAALIDVLCDYYGEGLVSLMKDPSTNVYYDKHVWILINGRSIRDLQGTDTMLKDGDKVMVTSPVGGM
ncbi:MAG: MoaD/ThiS family protein [Promethearchaeota archaeon]